MKKLIHSHLLILHCFLIFLIGCTIHNTNVDSTQSASYSREGLENLVSSEGENQNLIQLTSTPPATYTSIQGEISQNLITSSIKTITPDSNAQAFIPVPEHIVSDRILDFWWGIEENTLYYTTPGHFWKYNLSKQTIIELPVENSSTSVPQPNLSIENTRAIIKTVVSPSGKNIIYWTDESGGISTTGDGEQYLGSKEGVLWVVENGIGQQVTSMPFCYTDFKWSRNERIVLLIPDPLANCTDYRVMVFDLMNKTIKPVFPLEEYPNPIIIFDISPEGSYLLYTESDGSINQGFSAKIFDLATLESTSFGFPTPILRGQWVDSNTILVSYFSNQIQFVSLVSLSTLEEIKLFNTNSDDLLNKGLIFREKLSSDLQWIAFAMGENINSIDSLWLMKVP